MNKHHAYIAVFVIFFVFFLGIRIPGQNHQPGPKRKSRAVITQTFNKNLSISFDKFDKGQDNTTPVATLLASSYRLNMPARETLPRAIEQTIPQQRHLSLRSDRAPPRIS